MQWANDAKHFQFLLAGDCATPDVLMASAASVLEIYYGGGGLRKASMTDFGKFAGELAEELEKRDSPQARKMELQRKEAGGLLYCLERIEIAHTYEAHFIAHDTQQHTHTHTKRNRCPYTPQALATRARHTPHTTNRM